MQGCVYGGGVATLEYRRYVHLESSRFFNSVPGDERFYAAAEYAEYFAQIISSGVLSLGSNLQVSVSGTNMQTTIADGYAWIDGYSYKVEGGHTLVHAAAHATLDRIDRVVLRLNLLPEARSIQAMIRVGTPAGSPQPPALVRTGDIYELSLACVLVKAGLSTIVPGNVTDERSNVAVCGLASIKVGPEFALLGDFLGHTSAPAPHSGHAASTHSHNASDIIAGILDAGLLPAIAITDTFVVSTQAAMLALTVQVGDVCVRTDISKSYILKALPATTLANWQELLNPVSPVQSVAGKTGVVTLTKGDVGLDSVTNESKSTMFTSPAFTGNPTAPTQAAGNDSTRVATTAFVTAAIVAASKWQA